MSSVEILKAPKMGSSPFAEKVQGIKGRFELIWKYSIISSGWSLQSIIYICTSIAGLKLEGRIFSV